MRVNLIFFILTTSLLINGFLVYKVSDISGKEIQEQARLPYLSKRIFVENQNDILINFIPLRATIRKYVEKQNGKIGVYFEYLPSGTSIGANDREEVRLTSLSKVPMAMSILKKIERGEMYLRDNLTIEKEHINQGFGTLWKKGEGTVISVEELLRLSLTESDNTAYYVLSDQLKLEEINEVYRNLDILIDIKEESGKIYPVVSPKNYSSIFKSLYLSSFLLKENSNYILELLTNTIFTDKIASGVPDTVKVAHKVGVFEEVDTTQNIFIDCGIVYIPNRPYILCMFVEDSNKLAEEHMSYISKIIYEYIKEVKGGEQGN